MNAKAAICEESAVADLVRLVPDPEELRLDSSCAVRHKTQEVLNATPLPFPPATPQLEIHKTAAEDPAHSQQQELAVWILVVLLLMLSLAAGYFLWAKVVSTWPFSQ